MQQEDRLCPSVVQALTSKVIHELMRNTYSNTNTHTNRHSHTNTLGNRQHRWAQKLLCVCVCVCVCVCLCAVVVAFACCLCVFVFVYVCVCVSAIATFSQDLLWFSMRPLSEF